MHRLFKKTASNIQEALRVRSPGVRVPPFKREAAGNPWPWHDVDSGEKLPTFNVVIEIPFGSSNKYELDKKSGLLRLDRVLYSAVYYPANYGFIPQTLAEDGDPLDVLVLGAGPVVPLTIVVARAIGLMTMSDEEELDHKIIAVHVNDPEYNSYQEWHDLPPHRVAVLRRFFEDYKFLERKRVLVEDVLPTVKAVYVIERSLDVYRRWKSGEDVNELLEAAYVSGV
jgi:inorganic pyrophosphatase